MQIQTARKILQAFADDTRLRIINLLKEKELSVTDICNVLDVQQSNVSKHLSRLRLSGVVNDRREGLNVFYSLIKPKEKVHKKLLNAILLGLADNDVFNKDCEKMNEIGENKINHLEQ